MWLRHGWLRTDCLLIEPLWNWNKPSGAWHGYSTTTFNRTIVELKLIPCNFAFHTRRSFNRTIVELKLLQASSQMQCYTAFNRTIVELKHDRSEWFGVEVDSFNRTIVELKLPSMHVYWYGIMLLIEPLWNWNIIVTLLIIFVLPF